MDKTYFDAVISEMQVLLDGQKFTEDNGIYKNDVLAVKIEFDEEKRLFNLLTAPVEDGNTGDFTVAESWLFDEDQTVKDAAAVGVDFADTLRKKLGLKKGTAKANASDVDLPTANKGSAVTVLTLTQKLLAFYPAYKDAYRESVAQYGKFLYLDFFTEKFVPEIKNTITNGTKKQIKKLFDMLTEIYVEGDSTASDAVTAVICAAVYDLPDGIKTVETYCEECNHLSQSVRYLSDEIKHNKKLKTALKIAQ